MSQSIIKSYIEGLPPEIIRERIRQNMKEEENKRFSSHVIENIPACVIEVNLERAVFEYALLFRHYTKDKLEANHKNFIIDLSNTLFLDSTFLGSIIVFLKQVNKIGGTLRLIINQDKIAMITQIENISNIVDTFSSMNEAIVNV